MRQQIRQSEFNVASFIISSHSSNTCMWFPPMANVTGNYIDLFKLGGCFTLCQQSQDRQNSCVYRVEFRCILHFKLRWKQILSNESASPTARVNRKQGTTTWTSHRKKQIRTTKISVKKGNWQNSKANNTEISKRQQQNKQINKQTNKQVGFRYLNAWAQLYWLGNIVT